MEWLIRLINTLNENAGVVSTIQTLFAIVLSFVAIYLAKKANYISKLPLIKNLAIVSYLDLDEKNETVLTLRIINIGHAAVQIDSIVVINEDKNKASKKLNEAFYENAFENNTLLAYEFGLREYILTQQDVYKRLNIKKDNNNDDFEKLLQIIITDSEGKHYTFHEPWAYG